MKQRAISFVISALIFLLVGCGGSFDIYSPSHIHRTVQSRGPNLYVVYYEWPYVEERFGRDRGVQPRGQV